MPGCHALGPTGAHAWVTHPEPPVARGLPASACTWALGMPAPHAWGRFSCNRDGVQAAACSGPARPSAAQHSTCVYTCMQRRTGPDPLMLRPAAVRTVMSWLRSAGDCGWMLWTTICMHAGRTCRHRSTGVHMCIGVRAGCRRVEAGVEACMYMLECGVCACCVQEPACCRHTRGQRMGGA